MAAILDIQKIMTPEEEKFCKMVAMGVTYSEAFKTNFPERAAKCKNVTSAAYSMLQKVHIATFIKELVEARKNTAIESMQWTREKSIENLSYVINVCKNDIAKIQKAREEELQFLIGAMEDPNQTPAQVKQIIQNMLKLRQKSDINKVQIAGIVDAVAELNQMCGFNETNINMNRPITFDGEAEILE